MAIRLRACMIMSTPPQPHTVSCLAHLSARRHKHVLPSSTRAGLRFTHAAAGALSSPLLTFGEGQQRRSTIEVHPDFLRLLTQGAPYPPPLLFCIGWVGVGWQRHRETCRSLRELDNQVTVFLFFWRSPTAGCRVINHLCEVKNLYILCTIVNDRIA